MTKGMEMQKLMAIGLLTRLCACIAALTLSAMPQAAHAQNPAAQTFPAWQAPTPDDDLVLVGDLLFRIPRWLKVEASSITPNGDYLDNFRTPTQRFYKPHGAFSKVPFKASGLYIDIGNLPPWGIAQQYGIYAFIRYTEIGSRNRTTCSPPGITVFHPDWNEKKITDPIQDENYYVHKLHPTSGVIYEFIFQKHADLIFNRKLYFSISKEFEPWAPKEYNLGRQYSDSFFISKANQITIKANDRKLSGYSIFYAALKIEELLKLIRVEAYDNLMLWPHSLGECPTAKQ
jgi:hypothetical protein